MTLVDEPQRRRALTSLNENLFVEAAAGTGKTALMAGRIAMLLAEGRPPGDIAAITFTELAASELTIRLTRMVESLLAGEVPRELRIALPNGLNAAQRQRLGEASVTLDELTTSTIHGFCQEAIRSYAVETGLDPGSRVIDASGADAMFEGVLSDWLIERLSGEASDDDPIAVLSKDDPLKVVELIRELAELKRRHPTATTEVPSLGRRQDIDLCQAVDDFERWLATTPSENGTTDLLDQLRTLSAFYTDALCPAPSFKRLWQLAQTPRVGAMKYRSFDLKVYQRKTAWINACGAEAGAQHNQVSEERFEAVEQSYKTLLGAIGAGLVQALSAALDQVLGRYRDRKRAAAVLDFDDLLACAYELVSKHEAVRTALGGRHRHIFVDEFQDTDRVQAAIIFLIATDQRADRWQDGVLRPGSLFLVGDPKQAIYRFRGADVAAYEDARAAMKRQGGDCILQVTANFRSSQGILDHVNTCFEPVLNAPGQPGYVELSATIENRPGELPCAAKVTIEIPEGADPQRPSAAEQRDAEADIIAQLCRRLIGSVSIVRDDGRATPLVPGDIALLAPTGSELWRYERALESQRLSVASQAGKTLMLRQETQDILALLRTLADPFDTLSFGALMRGPLVGLTEEQLLDIDDAVNTAKEPGAAGTSFTVTTSLELIVLPLAKTIVGHLQDLRRRASVTTPLVLLSEAIERLQLRVVLATRYGNRAARALANLDALIEMARPYGVAGLRSFVRSLNNDWEARTLRGEGRIDASEEAVQIVTIHSSKGLEWPVVIPINTSTVFRSPPQFVHRQSDNTLHWVIGGVAPPNLIAAREDERRSETLERQRMWYVACTRARDLLVIPELPSASAQSWSRIVNLAHGSLPELDLRNLPPASIAPASAIANSQTIEIFLAQADAVSAAAPPINWRRPSEHDSDRALALETTTVSVEGAFEFVQPLGAGRLRGVLLHKLMEEFLTGELGEDEDTVEGRAKALLDQLAAVAPEGAETLPNPKEAAQTALRTLHFPEIDALRPSLLAETTVWAAMDGSYLAGRADAISVVDGQVQAVLDWKGDIAPAAGDRAGYRGQLAEYLTATGAPRGALVYMSLGEVEWVENLVANGASDVRGGAT
jgi:ATP-dependent exoDNAse (exonuclease V) beta subunit